MRNKIIDKIHKILTKNKSIVVIIIILGVVGTLYSFWPSDNTIDNSNNVLLYNSTLTDSPIIQGSSNFSVTYNDPPDGDVYTPFYRYSMELKKDNLINGNAYDYYNLKFIMPDDQEAFIPEVLFNKSYVIGSCNEESTDCYVYHKFRINDDFKEEDTCWIFTTRFGHDIGTDSQRPAKLFNSDSSKCIKLVVN